MGDTGVVLEPRGCGKIVALEPLVAPRARPAQGPANRIGGFALQVATDGISAFLYSVGHGHAPFLGAMVAHDLPSSILCDKPRIKVFAILALSMSCYMTLIR
jgi:hypothetical protein